MVRWMRKKAEQKIKTKISCLTGARNNVGNKSLMEVMTLSTVTNWRQDYEWLFSGLYSTEQLLVNKQSVQHSYMCVDTEQNEHQEKADGPELWQRHHRCSLRVSNEGQTWTCESQLNKNEVYTHHKTLIQNLVRINTFRTLLLQNTSTELKEPKTLTSLWIFICTRSYTWLSHSYTLFLCHESQYREDDKPSNKTGSAVQQTQPKAVSGGQSKAIIKSVFFHIIGYIIVKPIFKSNKGDNSCNLYLLITVIVVIIVAAQNI